MDLQSILEQNVARSAFGRGADHEIQISFKKLFQRNGDLSEQNYDVINAWESGELTSAQIIDMMTPSFQRENTKWTLEMQRRFIENIICGCPTVIELYDLEGPGFRTGQNQSKILDGLQRLTSCSAFVSNEFGIFEENLHWDEIRDLRFFKAKHLITMRTFIFKDEFEACQFYIDKNRGITHSEDDLLTAYKFMEQRPLVTL